MKKPAPITSLVSFEIRRAAPGMFTMGSRSVLDSHNLDAQLVTQADLEQLRQLLDEALPRHVHNTDDEWTTDPSAHAIFKSVCCDARIYRCDLLIDGLPSTPLVSQGEDACRTCGVVLAQF